MTKYLFNNNQTGFTLVELLITTSLTVMLMLTITSLFMTFLIGNSKTNVRQTVKEEGLSAISQMEFLIKNAHYVAGECATNSPFISITSLDGGTTTYSTLTNEQSNISQIASNSSILTSSSVNVQNLNFDCTGETGNRQIKISFELNKIAPTLGQDAPISEKFETIVNMRN